MLWTSNVDSPFLRSCALVRTLLFFGIERHEAVDMADDRSRLSILYNLILNEMPDARKWRRGLIRL